MAVGRGRHRGDLRRRVAPGRGPGVIDRPRPAPPESRWGAIDPPGPARLERPSPDPEADAAVPNPGPSRWQFPDPATAGEDGLVGIGADLEPATLLDAYRRGIFPWPHPGAPLPWFSPDPRGVIPLDGVAVSRSLRARLRRSGWETTVDRAFAAVLAGCADRPRTLREGGTWITPPMRAAYLRLHELGHAHSLEVWAGGALVGGLYGVGVGGVFT